MPDFPKTCERKSSIGRARLPNHPEPLSGLESKLTVKFTMTLTNAPSQEFPIGRSLGTDRLAMRGPRPLVHARRRSGGSSRYRDAVRYASTTYTLVESIL